MNLSHEQICNDLFENHFPSKRTKNPDAFSNKQRLKSKIVIKFLIPSLDKPYHCERCKESGLIS
jgi:hypothetical protein